MTAINCTAALTLSLTAAATLGNQHMFVVIANGGKITIDPDGAETINGSTTIIVPDGDRAIVFCNGTLFLALVEKLEGSEGTAVASAATTDIWSDDGDTVHITGTTIITSFGTAPRVGAWRKVIFDDALTLTDGVNLNVPGSANITTAADDFAFVYAETTTLFKVLYFKADGKPVVGAVSQAIQSAIEAETNEDTYIPPDLLKHNPGVAKVWCYVDRSAGTPSLSSPSHNVASVTDDGVAQTIVTITIDHSTAVYSVGGAGIGDLNGPIANPHTLAAGSFKIECRDADGLALDTTDFTCWTFGDQA